MFYLSAYCHLNLNRTTKWEQENSFHMWFWYVLSQFDIWKHRNNLDFRTTNGQPGLQKRICCNSARYYIKIISLVIDMHRIILHTLFVLLNHNCNWLHVRIAFFVRNKKIIEMLFIKLIILQVCLLSAVSTPWTRLITPNRKDFYNTHVHLQCNYIYLLIV